MTAEKVLSVLDIYSQFLKSSAAHANLQGLRFVPERTDVTKRQSGLGIAHQMEKLSHVWWCVEHCKTLVTEGRIEKAFRWLGFIQGALWYHGFYSIEELANHNRPGDETPDLNPDRGSGGAG